MSSETYDPFRGARPRATTSGDPKEQQRAEKARDKEPRKAANAVKAAVDKGEITPEQALQDEIAAGRTGDQRGSLVRWLQKKIAERAESAAPATANPPVPQDVTPETINPDGDTRLDPSIAAPIGGGTVPSIGPRAGAPE